MDRNTNFKLKKFNNFNEYRIIIGGCEGGAAICFSLIIIGAGGGGVGGCKYLILTLSFRKPIFNFYLKSYFCNLILFAYKQDFQY